MAWGGGLAEPRVANTTVALDVELEEAGNDGAARLVVVLVPLLFPAPLGLRLERVEAPEAATEAEALPTTEEEAFPPPLLAAAPAEALSSIAIDGGAPEDVVVEPG